jgi:hypothetical protein
MTNKKQETINNKHKPLKTLSSKKSFDASFLIFWELYPKKVGKDDAHKIWLNKNPDIDMVINTLEWQINCDQWKRGFIPNPATYLNQGRWQDEKPLDTFNDWLNPTKQEYQVIENG